MTTRRDLLRALPVIPAILSTSSVFAQPTSGKPLTLIVSASAGTTVDAVARIVAEPLAKTLGIPVVVENRPGAGGALGSSVVARAEPDGHTMLMTGVTHFSSLYSGDAAATYDPIKDFRAVAKVCSAALAIVVPVNSPYKTLPELLAAMKANPDEINYASGGVGSTSHLCTTILNDLTGTKAKHIPYKGNTQAVTDTIGGVVAFTCQGSGGVLPLIQVGRLRALAVTSTDRWDSIPNVPTGIESGVPSFDVSSWMAVFAPTNAPDDMVKKVSDGLAKIARSPEFKKFCDQQSMFVDLMEHKEFQAILPQEDQHWRRVGNLVKRAS